MIYNKVESALNPPVTPLPKAVQQQVDRKARGEDGPQQENNDPVFLEKVARLKEKVAALVASRHVAFT